MTEWLYQNKPITVDQLGNAKAFVYCITNLKNGKKYFGKKKFLFIKHRRIPGRIKRVKTIKTSDWETYYGSCKELHSDIEKFGVENFRREILLLCDSLSMANYYELKYQMENDVLLKPDLYYNAYVGSRINRMQMGIK